MPRDAAQLQLRRLHDAKQVQPFELASLGPEMLGFFKHSVQKRQNKLSVIAACFEQLVPDMLLDHCALESFQSGTLKVIVDSSPHLYQLKQLLLAGLQQQILLTCKSTGLRKITLKSGRWYDGDNKNRKIRFT